MRNIIITPSQRIVNMINAKQDFTYPLLTKRYIVGMVSKFEGANPSLEYTNIYTDVSEAIKDCTEHPQHTFGGWLNKETNTYCVDSGASFDDLDNALGWAESYNQICIYDSVDGVIINVNK